ncbi:endonuclease [Pontibacter diazotrophicus]|uniref:Endonuclease n=1 Tax=Pontibacter diazotrophicus TaxID=1400979 RepID=A0A3D8LGL9_9BACT|nr:endonuclease [Pontibacter diazotrophicus]RDV16560.1 endonuclease [Pontibacter diazotrophicus]
MPEGPQIIFLKEQAEQFTGQLVLEPTGNAKDIPLNEIAGQALTAIKTHGKALFFCFPHVTIRIHLMLFGKYAINGKLNRELRLGLAFETGEINFYACDCRLIRGSLDELYDWSTDVMHVSFDPDKALEKLYSKPNRLICDGLLDQDILAGVGNGIKNEVLFRRQVHPESIVGEIPELELRKLLAACVAFCFEYLDWKREGAEVQHWQVYRQKQCPRDRIPLRKEKIGKTGRSCYFCDKCQKLYIPDSIG